MIQNNYSVLPFYTDLNKQTHRRSYAYGQIYPLITPDKTVLPFQIIRPHRANGFSLVALKKLDGSTFLTIATSMAATGLEILNKGTYDIIKYTGLGRMGAITTPEGQYYLEISDGIDTWYSEVFNIVVDYSKYLKLEFRNTDNIFFTGGEIDYSSNFRYVCYLGSEIGKPEYRFDEEAEDKDGYTFVEKQVSEKVFRFMFVAPEYLCDALRLVRLNDYVRITSNGDIYDIEKILITPEWTDDGLYASVEVEFECDTVVKKIAKGSYFTTSGSFDNSYDPSFDLD